MMSRDAETRRDAERRREAERGQSLVEFALVVPMFLLLLFGLIDAGRLVFANNTVSQAAREAVRVAHVQAPFIEAAALGTCTAPVCPADEATFRANVRSAANNMTSLVGAIPDGDLTLFCSVGLPAADWSANNDCADNNAAGADNMVSVRITVPIEPLLPLFEWFYPNVISAAATMALP